MSAVAYMDVLNEVAVSRHPDRPHTYSLTPLQLLPIRLNYRISRAFQRPQPRVVVFTEREIARAAPLMHNAMWGIDRVEEGEKAEAAAILEAVVSRWVVNKDDGGLMTRWLVDDEKKNGRIYDRLWGIETARLIPWRYAVADYNGPSLVYDVLIDKVRRIQIHDQVRFRDVEENLGVWGREMNVTKRRGLEEVEEGSEDMVEEESEEDEPEGDAMDEDE